MKEKTIADLMKDHPDLYYFLDELHADTLEFNTIAGTAEDISWEGIQKQMKFVHEEIAELQEAIDLQDKPEMLKELIDCYVVLNGVLSKFIAMGMYTSKAMRIVGENNLSKFPEVTDQYTIKNTKEMYRAQGIALDIITTNGRVIFKNLQTGKVLKPWGYKKVNLSDCV